jgi:TPR repeat protein
MYLMGEGGLLVDPAKAMALFRQAATAWPQGHATAQYYLAGMYLMGEGGLPVDPAKAAALFRQAADQGHAPAQFNLALMYHEGEGGLPVDPAKAAALLRQAADDGHALAQCELGTMYYNGKGVTSDYEEACRLLQQAVDQDCTKAMHELALALECEEDEDARAVQLLQRAVSKGLAPSMHSLAFMYNGGRGGVTPSAVSVVLCVTTAWRLRTPTHPNTIVA